MSAAGPRDAIEQALLDYQRSPGRHALARRQPALLFNGLKEVLQLASGRPPAGWGADAPSPAVQQAAIFFVGAALLAPGTDHYTLLGLPREADAAAVKERYRLLMRLLHPDFAAALPLARWPADAAARVNQAHEVLLSPVARRAYDATLEAASPPQPAAPSRAQPQRRSAVVPAAGGAKGRPADPRLLLKRLAAGFGAVGMLALAAALLANLQDRPELVQRADADRDPQPRARHPSAPAPQDDVAVATRPPEPAVPSATTAAELPPLVEAPTPREPVPPPAAARPQGVAAAQPMRTDAGADTARPARPPVAALPHAPASAPPSTAAAIPPPAAPAPAPATLAAAGAPLNAPPAPAATLVAMAPVQPAAVAAPAAVATVAAMTPPARPAAPGVTMADVHPILSRLLQQLETGTGERMLTLLERDARNTPAAQGLLRHYNVLVEGARSIKVASAQFRAEPQDGRLLVVGRVTMQVSDAQAAAVPREFAMQAEFVSRDGTVVMTQLARAQPRN